jgi:hypothetical protein
VSLERVFFAGMTRCVATEVNPATSERDLQIVVALERAFGHIDMGVDAEVSAGAEAAVGGKLTVLGQPGLPDVMERLSRCTA